MDEPYADSSAIPLWYLCRLARQHVTVALGGDGGDEVFAGYRTHYAWRLASLWRRLPSVLTQRIAPALVRRLPVRHDKVSFDLKARAFVSSAAMPAIEAHYGFKEFMSEDARRELAAHDSELDPTVRLFSKAVEHLENGDGLDAILTADFAVYLPDDILLKVDRMSMLHSLEARVPFLDHELVQTCAGLPAHYKLRGLTTKAILKESLKGSVPQTLLTRPKAGFNVPMATWLNGPLEDLLQELLSPKRVEQLGLWRPEKVATLISEHRAMRRDHSRTLWALMCFMLFNDRFRGGRAA
jgi:asparagine synthase (glutamine-hydrolysing)